MIILKEETDILAPFEKFLEWANNFEEEFVKWSPYHFECNLLDGGIEKGNKIRFYEIVMGMDYDVTGIIIESHIDDKHFLIKFMSNAKTAIITFEATKTTDGFHFSHTEAFGSQTPVIGGIINFMIFKVLYKKKCNWQLIRDDMILDNKYLSDILVNGKYPERIDVEKLKTK